MLTLLTSGCVTANSRLDRVIASCPPLKAYSKEFLIQVADQLSEVRAAHGDDAALQVIVTDYSVTRDFIRTCIARAQDGLGNDNR